MPLQSFFLENCSSEIYFDRSVDEEGDRIGEKIQVYGAIQKCGTSHYPFNAGLKSRSTATFSAFAFRTNPCR